MPIHGLNLKLQDVFGGLQVMRRVSGAEKFSGKNQYALRVSPGVDCAFMVAFCITVDELFND